MQQHSGKLCCLYVQVSLYVIVSSIVFIALYYYSKHPITGTAKSENYASCLERIFRIHYRKQKLQFQHFFLVYRGYEKSSLISTWSLATGWTGIFRLLRNIHGERAVLLQRKQHHFAETKLLLAQFHEHDLRRQSGWNWIQFHG